VDERRRRFEAMYANNHVVLLGYLLRRTDKTDDAADVLAETFLAAWRRLDEVPCACAKAVRPADQMDAG
jgi:DNA-directed RNA polymerase specialized sigma24 family protein